jgi:HNH endonuclease
MNTLPHSDNDGNPILKKCPKCPEDNQWHPATSEFFSRNKNRADGLQSLCKSCTKEYKKQHYQLHKEEISIKHKDYREAHLEQEKERSKRYVEAHREEYLEYHRKYYEENKEELLEDMKQNYQENREHKLEYQRQYAIDNRDQVLESKRQYSRAHKEEIRAYRHKHRERTLAGQRMRYHARYKEYQREQTKKYRATNREWLLENKRQYYKTPHGRLIDRIHRHKRRAQKLGAGGSYTHAQIQDQLKRQKYKCYWNHEKFEKKDGRYIYHIDHIVPLAKGGTNDIDNVVLACPTCNLRKSDKLLHEFPDFGRLL